VRAARIEKNLAESKRTNSTETADHFTAQRNKVFSALGNHPFQWIALGEVMTQLVVYRKRAEKQQNHELVRGFDKIIGIMNGVIEAKKENEHPADQEAVGRDEVYQIIQEKLKSF
jgi:hypothetical protein